MDRAKAAKLISHAVEATRTRWRQYDKHWQDIDRVFILHGYEQQGFEIFKFLPLLEKRGCGSIDALGSILREEDGSKYKRAYAGRLANPFYGALERGEREECGRALYDAIIEFQRLGAGSAGRCFWKLIWQLLVSCRYLRSRHSASFRHYILDTFSKYVGQESIADDRFLSTPAEDWRSFLDKTKPWEKLLGIGENTFDFIFGDIVKARFAPDAYKLDDANRRFLRVTGIIDLIGALNRKDVIRFMRGLETSYSLREMNKGIYTYCSVTEGDTFGFCRSSADCTRCGANAICDKRIGEKRDGVG